MEDRLKRVVGTSIAVARRRKGLSQRGLAVAIGARAGQISDWERGRFLPSLEAVVTIARELDVSLDELVYGERTFQERAIAEAGRVMREQLPALIAEALKEQGLDRGQ